MRSRLAIWALVTAVGSLVSSAQSSRPSTPGTAPSCFPVTQEDADKSAGIPNVTHAGGALPGVTPPDISKGFQGIPRSAQPPLTVTQTRILECKYRLPEANAEMPYAIYVPSTYQPGRATPLIVDLHGLNITPLMQILFDGTTDFAEKFGFIVVAPMGFSVSGWWGAIPGSEVATAGVKPDGGDRKFTVGELSEIDAMTLLKSVREQYTVDPNRIYLMGHSMGGMGTYYLGAKYNDTWAAIAPLSGVGGIEDDVTATRFRKFQILIMHGDKDSIVSVGFSRRSVLHLQNVGAQFLYLEMPGKDHEFWIRRGAENMEKVFHFFSMTSKHTQPGFMTPEMIPQFAPFPPKPKGK